MIPNDQVLGGDLAGMGVSGQLVTLMGVIAILLPPAAVIMEFIPGVGFPLALTYAPTFVIGGILLFVIGTALRVYTTY